MKNLELLLAIAAALLLGGCSKSDPDWHYAQNKWREEPGVTKIVMKEDSITSDGMTVTPVRYEDARLVRDQKEKRFVVKKEKGFHFFYLVIEAGNAGTVEYVVRQRRTTLTDSGEPKTEELDVTTAQGMYPSSRVVRCSYSYNSEDRGVISNEYIKLLSVKRKRR